jgi:hypothetical protein
VTLQGASGEDDRFKDDRKALFGFRTEKLLWFLSTPF